MCVLGPHVTLPDESWYELLTRKWRYSLMVWCYQVLSTRQGTNFIVNFLSYLRNEQNVTKYLLNGACSSLSLLSVHLPEVFTGCELNGRVHHSYTSGNLTANLPTNCVYSLNYVCLAGYADRSLLP